MSHGVTAKGGESGCVHAATAAAYLDGELEPEASSLFETHARECAACSDSLLEQRRLLCLLDTAFDDTFEKKVALPADFTRVVRARAQTDMSGVRARGERARALKICAALALATCALLGAALFDAAFVPVVNALRAAAGVAGVAGHAAADAGAGAGVIARAVGGRFVAGSEPLLALQWLAFIGALLLLLRLISRYHRAGARD
ncbi:MAG TPA: zf-HC2 domain-containing protein [Pyrinomonadaceae bacterium]|nr:zf-HC2 domain-containing protein [Pyrinomonadaceae bacterium]